MGNSVEVKLTKVKEGLDHDMDVEELGHGGGSFKSESCHRRYLLVGPTTFRVELLPFIPHFAYTTSYLGSFSKSVH